MSYTDNKNQQPEYNVEKKMNNDKMNYMLSKDFSENKSVHKMFHLGGGVPKLYSDNLSYNNIDIESKLRGIKSTNLEGLNFNPELQSKKVLDKALFERQKTYVPPSFMHTCERRGFHNL